MNYTKNIITLRDSIDYYPDSISIIDLIDIFPVTICFLVYSVIRLDSSVYLRKRFKMLTLKSVSNFFLYGLYKTFTISLTQLHLLFYFHICKRIKIEKCKIFHFILNGTYPKATGNRSIDIHSFMSYGATLLFTTVF